MIVYSLFILSFVFGQLATLVNFGARWSVLDWFAGFMVLWWIRRIFRRQKHIYAGRLLPWILAFAAVAGTSVVLRAWQSGGALNVLDVWYIGRWLMYAGVYALVVIDTKTFAWRKALYIAGVMMAAIGLLQVLFYPDLRNLMYLGWDPHYYRVFGTLFDPNFAGGIYCLTVLTGLWLWNIQRSSRTWIILGQFVTMTALLFTYSRSSFAAFVIGMVVWFACRRSYVKLVGIIIAFVALVWFLPAGMEGQNIFRSTSSLARIGSASVGWDRFLASPYVGSGFVAPLTSRATQALPSRAGTVDTSLLFVLAATGVFGFVSYVILSVQTAVLGFSALKRKVSDPLLLSSLAALFVHSLLINSLFYPWVMVWMWILIAETEKELTVGR